jgi:hypothetical protein
MGLGSGLSCDISLNTSLTPDERRRYQDPLVIRKLLNEARTIGILGLSSDPQRASYFVANYLQKEGYHILPINPRATNILGKRCYPDIASLPDSPAVDILEVFRPASEIPAIVEAFLTTRIPAIWLQLRLVDLPSAERARAAGRTVIMDKCLKMEHGRYAGTLNWGGMNTQIISARKAGTGPPKRQDAR